MNDLLDIFQAFKRMLCICPCCGEMMRLSDLHLRYVGKAPKTWLDKYEYKLLTQQKKEELFEQEEAKIREKSIERGRKKVPSHPLGCKRKMSNKRNVVLYLDKELVSKTRELGFNLSKTFENHLKHLVTQFSNTNPSHTYLNPNRGAHNHCTHKPSKTLGAVAGI